MSNSQLEVVPLFTKISTLKNDFSFNYMSSPSSGKWKLISLSSSPFKRREMGTGEEAKRKCVSRSDVNLNKKREKNKKKSPKKKDDTHKPDYPIMGVWPLSTTLSLLTEFRLSQSRDSRHGHINFSRS
jgi:hypothetical protein